MFEKPMMKKCCSCVPLRVCLQVWAWFKVVADLVASLHIFAGLLLFWMSHEYDFISQNTHQYFAIFLVILLLVDLIFVAVLIAGVLKKRNNFLRIFFYYGIFMILAEAGIVCLFLVLVLYKSPPRELDGLGLYCAIVLLIGITWIAIDISMIITLKSEMVKIRNKEQYDFSRIMNAGTVLDSSRTFEKYVERSFEEDSTKPENAAEKYVKLLD